MRLTTVLKKCLPVALVLAMMPACAEKKDAASSADTAGVEATILAKLQAARPDLNFHSVIATPAAGLYEVSIAQGGVVYVHESGEFFVAGELYQVQAQGVLNLTEQRRAGERAEALAGLNGDQLIQFKAKDEKAQIFVFTDVDCGYCRMLHQEVPRLNELGVTVNYLAFPRAGIGSDVYRRMASAWCSDDPQASMTTLKNGGTIPRNTCATHPVGDQYALGQKLGVNGTPAILLSNGTLIPGYKPADELVKMLDIGA